LKQVHKYEKKLEEINEEKQKIKKAVDLLIIEESSLDDEIRALKNKKGIEK
jgi:hypothetical protein